MTLSISVIETINVTDLLSSLKKFVTNVANWLFSVDPDEDDEFESGPDENRGPPALGVNVIEEIMAGEALS